MTACDHLLGRLAGIGREGTLFQTTDPSCRHEERSLNSHSTNAVVNGMHPGVPFGVNFWKRDLEVPSYSCTVRDWTLHSIASTH